MIRFEKERVLLLHKYLVEQTGGIQGLRDEALLDSALENAYAGFGDTEFYPTKVEKGARLGYSLIANHPFVDGNKRTGMYVLLAFLEVNGIRLRCSDQDIMQAGFAVADGSMDYEQLLNWVMEHRN